jgi:hypothetical protein
MIRPVGYSTASQRAYQQALEDFAVIHLLTRLKTYKVRLMESIKLKSHVGDDGVLQIQVPVDFKNEDLEVMIIFQRLKSRDNNSATLESRGWQP